MESERIPLYANEAEKRHHANAINLLCEELSKPMDIIRPMYEQFLIEMKRAAKIKDFLSIFVARAVRESAKEDRNQLFKD